MMSDSADSPPTVLICEDEAIIAMDLELIFEDLGLEVIGTYPSVKAAMAAIAAGEVPDLALLDVRLSDGFVFPVADALVERDVKIIFHSGHAGSVEMSRDYPEADFCPKPTTSTDIAASVRKLGLAPGA